MARNSLLGFLLRISAAAILLLIASIGLRDTRFGEVLAPSGLAQEKPPLGRIADLAVHKGFKDVEFAGICDPFGLSGRAEDGRCAGYQFNTTVDDEEAAEFVGWQKGWVPSFNTYVERGTGRVRIILVDHDSKTAYAYLTDFDGKLLNMALGSKTNRWSWSTTGTPDLRARFELEKSAWIKAEKDLAEMPDRKD